MAGIRIKKKNVRPTSLKRLQRQGSLSRRHTAGASAVATPAIAEELRPFMEAMQTLNASQELAPHRRWNVRAVFSFKRMPDGQYLPLRGVGVFVFRPRGVPAADSTRLIELPSHLEAEETANEIRAQAQALVAKDHFWFECDGFTGYERIDRDNFVDLIFKIWTNNPVNTNGDVDVIYDTASLKLPREDMLKVDSRERIFAHLREIDLLMSQGFRYNPWVEKLMRINPGEIGPWTRNR